MAEAAQLSQQQVEAPHHPHWVLQEVVVVALPLLLEVEVEDLRDQQTAVAVVAVHPYYPDPQAAHTVLAPAGAGAAADDGEEEGEREDAAAEVAVGAQRKEEGRKVPEPADADAVEEVHTVPAVDAAEEVVDAEEARTVLVAEEEVEA